MKTVSLHRHRLLAIVVAALLGVVLLYVIAGAIVLPRVLERELPAFSERHWGVRAQWRDLGFNPFLLRLSAHDLQVDTQDGEALLRAQSLFVDLQWAALFRRAPLLDAVRVDGLDLRIVRAADGRIDLAQLGRARGEQSASSPPRQLRLPHLRIGEADVRGAVHFIDRVPQPEVRSDFTSVDVQLLHLATDTDRDGRLRASAVLPEGGSLGWTARVGLQPLSSEGDVSVRALSPLAVWKHLRTRMSLAPPGGHLDFSSHYRMAYENGSTALSLRDIRLAGNALTLREAAADAPALKLARVTVQDGRFDLARRELVLDGVSLQTGAVLVATDASGAMNWQRMFASRSAPAAAGDGLPWHVRMPSLSLANVGFRYTDDSRQLPLRVEAQAMSGATQVDMAVGGGPVRFTAQGLRLAAQQFAIGPLDANAEPALKSASLEVRDGIVDLAAHRVELPGAQLGSGSLLFAVDQGGRMNWASLFAGKKSTGEVRRGGRPAWTIRFPALRATGLATGYRDDSRQRPLSARLASVDGGLDLTIAPGAPAPVALERVQLAGKALRVGPAGARTPLLSVSAVSLGNGQMQGHEVELAGLLVHDGDMQFTRNERGVTDWGPLLQSRSAAGGGGKAGQAWRVRLPGVRIERMALHYRDAARQVPLAVDVAALALGGDVQSGAGGLRFERLAARASGVQIGAQNASRKALTLASATASAARMQGNAVDVGAVELAGGRMQLARNVDGSLDLQALFSDRLPAAAPVKAASAARSASRLHVRCPTVRLRDFAVNMTDRTRATPIRIEADGITAQSAFDFVAGKHVRLSQLALRAGPLKLRQDDGPRITSLAAVALEGGELDTGARLLGARGIHLEGGALQVQRDARGQFILARSLSASTAHAPADRDRAPGTPEAPWRYRIGTASLQKFAAHYVDHAFTPPLTIDLPVRKAQLTHLEPGAAEPARFDVQLGVGAGGEARLAGTLAQDTRSAQAHLQLADVDLKALQPVLGQHLALQLESGTLAGSSEIRYRHDPDGPASIDSRGRAQITDFAIRETATGERFMAWKRLSAQPVIYGSHPAHLGIGEILVQAPEAKLEIAERGGLNLKHILKSSAASQAQASPSGQHAPAQREPKLSHAKLVETTEPKSSQAQSKPDRASPEPDQARATPDQAQSKQDQAQSKPDQGQMQDPTQPQAAPDQDAAPQAPSAQPLRLPEFVVRVDRLRLRDGRLRYADDSLVLPFDVMIKALNGTMISISNVPGEHARVRVEGRIDPFAYARAAGSIDLFSPRRFTDIRARFANVEMPRLSPYTITFAGRAIAAGRLWLDLNYKIVDSQLLGNNSVTVHDLKLGERVKAPRARDLPLDLAARLLTNQEGVISVDVPLRGDLNKPGFDYHGIIRKAIANTLMRLATSPFRFIGRLLGLAAEKVDRIAFEPGSDVLRPPQQEKLHDLAKSLKPGLRIELEPTFASEKDAQAMRRERVRRELARRLGLQLMPREDPGPTAYAQVATQRALEDMLATRGGQGAVEAFAGGFGGKVTRVRRDGPAIGPGSPDTAFYRALFDRLIAVQPLDEGALTTLARQRADAIVTYLARNVNIDPARVTQRPPADTHAVKDEGVQSELRLRKARARS